MRPTAGSCDAEARAGHGPSGDGGASAGSVGGGLCCGPGETAGWGRVERRAWGRVERRAWPTLAALSVENGCMCRNESGCEVNIQVQALVVAPESTRE